MKHIQLITGFLLCTFFAQAQVQIGVRAGIHSGDLKGNDLIQLIDRAGRDSLRIQAEDANVGFRIGVISRIRLGDIVYLQPEVVFRTASAQYRITDAFQSTDSIRFQDENFFLIDVPLLAGLKLGPLRFQAGPIASVRLDKNSDLEELESYKRSFQTAKWAFQYGFGLDLGKLAIDVNRQNLISDSDDDITIAGETFELAGEGNFWIFAIALYL